MNIEEDFLSRVKKVIGNKKLPLHEPFLDHHDKVHINECIDEGYVSSIGRFVNKFERDLENFTSIKNAVCVVNGTSALHAILNSAGVGINDEVLVPAISFIATANAIKYCGAQPNFVDVDENNMNICPEKLDRYLKNICLIMGDKTINKITGRTISAIVVVHVFGRPVELKKIIEIANYYNIKIIEDAAAALGSYSRGSHVCSDSFAGFVSFNGNKIITTGGGGAILTNCDKLTAKLRHLTTTAKLKHPWKFIHDEVGFNYRMPNLNAALGCSQIAKLPKILLKKKSLALSYQSIFKNCEYGNVLEDDKLNIGNNWLINFSLKKEFQGYRDRILETLNSNGISCRPIWEPIHHQSPYLDCQKDLLESTENNYSRFISLPSSANTLDA